jgi:hypothetical protein
MLKLFSETMLYTIRRVIIIYTTIISVHVISVHLYAYLCVPLTLHGWVMSSFMVATPHCNGLSWTIQFTKVHIINMWILLGAFICTHIEQIINKTKTP